MMIDHINGNLSGGLSFVKTDGLKSSSFNRMLADTTASLSGNSQLLHGRMETPHTDLQQEPTVVKLVKIGTISSKTPTVSNILIQNPALKKECWNIIYASQNEGKEYTRIRAGTDIYLNPETKELLWGDMIQKTTSAPAFADAPPRADNPETAGAVLRPGQENLIAQQMSAGPDAQTNGLSEKLVKAVEPMIGKTYSDINCYELLVNGLSKLGVRYTGRGGLGRKLMARAMDKGLPMNTYLNGEGLIELSGSKVYGRSFLKINDAAGQAKKVIQEIAPHLEKGSVLSFSTESRGHTGIVSNKNGKWTFINSGVMDNPVDSIIAPKGVGEEKLKEEIENWFHLAAERNESLVITLGKFNQNKLAAFGENKELTI